MEGKQWITQGLSEILAGCARRGNLEHVNVLLATGYPLDLNAALWEGAEATGCVACVSRLLEAGADANNGHKQGAPPPLLRACRTVDLPRCDCYDDECGCPVRAWPQPEMVAALLDHGADPNGFDSRGTRALHVIVEHRGNNPTQLGVIRALLDRDADPNVADDFGQTPLHVAAKSSHRADNTDVMAALLASSKIDVNCRDCRGNTPLHIVCTGPAPRASMIQLLVNNGADITVEDNENSSLWDRFAQSVPGNTALAKQLLLH